MYVDECADALTFILERYGGSRFLNVGTGIDTSIQELAEMIADVTGYKGAISFDPSKPDGMPSRCMDVGRMKALGWTSQLDLQDGLKQTYEWFLNTYEAGGAAGFRGTS